MAVVGELLTLFLGNNTQLLASTAQSETALRGYAATSVTQGEAAAVGLRTVGLAAASVTAAAAIMGAVGVRAAADFQEQMAIINTIAHQTPEELSKTGDAIRQMAAQTGTPLSDMTKAFYDLLSAGVPVSQAMSVLQSSVTLAIGGLATTAQTVDLLTTAINAYHLNANQARVATDQFALAVQDGKVTADQIAATFADIAPLARQAGIGIDEISAAYAVLTSRGVPAAEVTTQMNRAVVELLKPNADLAALQDKLGISFADVASQKGLVVALQEMRVAAEANGVPFQDLFGRLEGLKFALSTTGPNFAGYASELVKMHDATGTAAEQAAERMGTFNRQVDVLGASVQNAFISVGTSALPMLTTLLLYVKDAVQGFTDWSEANPGLAASILAVAGGVGLLIVGLLSLGIVLGLVGTAVAVLTSPLALLLIAVAALAVGFITNFGGIRDAITGAIGAIGGFVIQSGVLQHAAAVAQTVLTFLGQVVGALQAGFAAVSSWVGNFVSHLTGASSSSQQTTSILSALHDGITRLASVLANVIGFVTSVASQFLDAANKAGIFKAAGDVLYVGFGLLGTAIRVVLTILAELVAVVSGALSAAFNAFKVVIDTIMGSFKTLADSIQNVITLAKQAVDAVANVPGVKLGADVAGNVGGAIGNIAGALPHFQSGGVVPGNGPQLAVVHGGETVTPSGQGGTGSVTVHTHLNIDGKEIAELIEEHLFRNASNYSSGFLSNPGTTGA